MVSFSPVRWDHRKLEITSGTKYLTAQALTNLDPERVPHLPLVLVLAEITENGFKVRFKSQTFTGRDSSLLLIPSLHKQLSSNYLTRETCLLFLCCTSNYFSLRMTRIPVVLKMGFLPICLTISQTSLKTTNP